MPSSVNINVLDKNYESLTDKDVDLFLSNMSEFFGYSLTRMMSLPKAERDRLQTAGIRLRFQQFYDTIPMLRRLADSQGISEVNEIEDAAPLLFSHAIYKSYPTSILDNHRYGKLTAWLDKLTSYDLSKVDVSQCKSIDDWMKTIERETPVRPCHTSGTSGSMSFLPWGKSEAIRSFLPYLELYFQEFGTEGPGKRLETPLNIDCAYPGFRFGGSATTFTNDLLMELIAGSDDRFYAAFPHYMSADLMRQAAMYRAAVAKGQEGSLKLTPEIAARRDEFIALQRNMPDLAAEFLSNLRTKLAGKRIFMLCITALLYPLAENGLKQGVRGLFAPDSIIVTGGGAKGLILPDDWREKVQEFLGVDRLYDGYGMSEMLGSQLPMCKHGHYHATPNMIPYLLDVETNALLPRTGTVTGRFAFYDLTPDAHWGGFITGDEVTMEWDAPCACGQSGPYVTGKIKRVSENHAVEGEEKITCAATPGAIDDALEFIAGEHA